MKILTLPLGALQTNCYLVCDEETKLCAVIDPGASAARVLERAQQEGLTIAAVLLTHGHFDHVGALAQLHRTDPGMPIFVHAADTNEETNMSHGKLVYTDTYAEGEKVVISNQLQFTVLHTPGHTPGSVCLSCGNALFSGDTLFEGSCGRVDFPGGSADQMFASLKRLSLLEGDPLVYPGHGPSTTLEAERRYNPYMKEAARR